LTVTASNGGGISTASHTIIVNDYAPPIASFSFAPATPKVDQLVSFTDASAAGSGTITAMSWNFGDGGTSTDQNPTHAYSSVGEKTVSLTVTNSNGKQSTTTQTLTVTSTTLSNQVALIITTPSSTNVGSAFSITVTARDETGSIIPGYAGTVHFTSSDGQATLPADSTLSGTTTFSVTLKTTGSQTITVGDGTTTSTSGLIIVNPIAAAKLVFTAGDSQSITATVSGHKHVSSVITVQMQDTFSNPVMATSATSIALTSDSTGKLFYSDQGNTQITTATIAVGSSSASFYYSDSVLGTPTITATAGTLTVSTKFTINSFQLVFTDGTTQTFAANTISPVGIRVQSQSADTNPHNPGSTLTVALSSSSTTTGTFYSDSNGNNQITSITISTRSPYAATFYYKDTAQGTPTITASASSYTSATTSFVITGQATQLKFTTGASQSIFVGQISSTITVSQQDTSGNAIKAAAPLPVTLTRTSTTGAFYNNGQGTGNPITQITIAQGATSANLFYKDTTAGSSTITASSTGLTSATTTLTITSNHVSDGGFDQSGSNSPWHASGTGYATNHETNDAAPQILGPYAELETVPPGFSATGSGILTNTFSPAIAVNSIPNVDGSLSMWIYNNGYLHGTGYYSFQVTLTASDGTQLIYWWGNNPATAPAQTNTVKVINWGTIDSAFTLGQWIQFTRNLNVDWSNAGLSSSTSLTSIALQCNGYHISSSQYGQELFVDNVAIQ
jgi:PKD repeat protein